MEKIYFRSFLIALLILLPEIAHSNTQKVDSINSHFGYEFIVSNTRQAIQMFTKNVNDAEKIGYTAGMAKAYYYLGLANYIHGNYDEATESYITSIKIYEQLGDVNQQAYVYGEFGYQLKRRDMEKANYYMRFAIRLAEENKLPYLTANKLYANYGVLKEMEGDLDSALFLYEKTLALNLSENDSLGLPYTYNKIAGVKAMNGDYIEAYNYLKLSDDIRVHEEGNFGRAENLSVWGDILKSQNRYKESIIKYEECLNLSKGIGYKYLIQYCSQNLRELYEKLGNYKQALYYYDYYSNYTDSLTNLETNSRIAELEISYETEKKDRLIAESNLEIEEKSRQFFIAVGVALFLALSSLGIYKYQQQKRETERKELKLQTQLKEAELENKLSSEKLRISRELHDNIGSQLTFMISSLDNLSYVEKNEKLLTKLNRLSSFGRDTMKELRNTIWAMKHEEGDINSLYMRLNELVQNLNQANDGFQISVINEIETPVRLSSIQTLAIFRVVQEAIQNTIKYAEAEKVDIKIFEEEHEFVIQIEDDGKGFDIDEIEKGNGLDNMKHRCEEANGRFMISSNNNGTRVQCMFDKY